MLDRVQPAPPESGHELYIFSNQEKPGWRVRTPGDQTHAPHPGSAICYEDRIYELRAIEPADGTPYVYRYALQPWEDRLQIRQVFQYSLEAARETGRQIAEQQKREKQFGWGVWWFAFTGLIPTPVATRWQREWNLPMRRSAMISVFLLSGAAAAVGPELQRDGRHEVLVKIMLYLVFEQIVRFFWLLGSSDAVGSLTLTAIWILGTILSGRNEDGSEFSISELQSQRDEVRLLTRGEEGSAGPWDVEVRSMLRDPVLVNPSPVRYDGQVYQPLPYIQEGEGIRRRYVFRLKKLDPATPARREYIRERTPAQLQKLVAYERTKERVHALAFFCGMLPYQRQLALERTFDFPAGLWTQRTAKTLALVAAMTLLGLFHGRLGPTYLAAIYFLLESLWRLWVAYRRGDASGSLLGWLLMPVLPGG
jgi:hypothetical protein